MSTTLSQSSTSAFPDLSPNGSGLRVEFALGLGGQHLDLPLKTSADRVFFRLVLRIDSLVGGPVRIAGAQHATAGEAWSLNLDPTLQTLSVVSPWASPIQASIPKPTRWATVEIGFDLNTHTLMLWINGQLAGTTAISVATPQVDLFWAGGVFKSHDTLGDLSIDEWIIADHYIGPVIVPPSSEHAEDPSRWLVIYNTADPDAEVWAEAYRAAHNVPYANLLGLSLSLNESISFAEYLALLDQIETYLDLNGLGSQVMGLLVGYRVPGYVLHPEIGVVFPTGSFLSSDLLHLFAQTNPHASLDHPTRPTAANLGGVRLTARIDGPSLAEALALINRSVILSDQTLLPSDQLLVAATPNQPSLATRSADLMAWYRSVERQKLRLPSQLSGDPVTQPDAEFSEIDHDAFYWGWGQTEPPTGFFASPAGSRIVSVQIRTSNAHATTLRGSTPSNWIDTALSAGYAAAIGSSLNYSISSIPRAEPFFEALRRGWTLAEAWLVSQPFLRDGLYLVGDPLLTVLTPKAGWDIFGPLERIEDLDPDKPSAALPEDQHQYTPASDELPADQTAALYLLRRRDELGRSEAGFTSILVGNRGGTSSTPPPSPAWPTASGWSLSINADTASAQLVLGQRAVHTAIHRIEFLDDLGSPPIVAKFSSHGRYVRVSLPLTNTPARYRWRVVAPGGLATLTPWSAPIHTPLPTAAVLTPLES